MDLDQKTASAVAAYIPKAIEVGKKAWARLDQSLDYAIRESHTNYACSIVEKYSKAKSFFIRAAPVDLYDFYVPASVGGRGISKIKGVDLGKLRGVSLRVIISGSGGSGKTIMMRHLLLDSLVSGSSFPILVELRNLNDDNSRTLEDEIYETLGRNNFKLDRKYVNKSLEEGLFVLLFDGFDEVQFKRRKAIEREIKRFAGNTKCQVVITSRADVSLQSWDSFTNLSISNLVLDEACELIEKIPFDDDIKGRFEKSLRSGLFDSHQFFLSNPLLLSIMLLTYGNSADIPRRQSSFYLQAYEALFQQHDALKSGFKRDRKTDLDVYEFAKMFSAFSIVSYDARAFRFSRVDALRFTKKASEIAGIANVSAEGFVEDAKQAVCLLMEDGLELAFAHRTFQEFFAAKFIAESEESLQRRLVQKYIKNKYSSVEMDSVLDLLYEMAPLVVERHFLIPALSELFGLQDKRRVSKKFWFEAFKKCFSGVRVESLDAGNIWFVVDEKGSKAHQLLSFIYSACFDSKTPEDAKLSRKMKADIFASKYGEGFSKDTKTISVESELAADLSGIHVIWSIDGLERVRTLLRDMRRRAAMRSSTLDRVFSP